MKKETNNVELCFCGQKSVHDGFCKQHLIEKNEQIFLDNTNGNYGIIRWAKTMIPEWLPNKSPKFHFQILDELFRLFDPFYKNRYERQLNILSYRGSSKSTLINGIFLLYLITHNGKTMKIKGINNNTIEVVIDKRNIVIASETGSSAEDFVVRLRDELDTNGNLKYYYKYAIEDAIDDKTGQWTRRAFKINGCYVIGIGVGMQIRGKVKGASRPDLVIFDDIYSENNVKTKEGRDSVTKWFSRATSNTLDDLKGMSIFVGTVLHEDTVLVQNRKSKNWKTIQIPVMDLNEFKSIVDKHLVVNINAGLCKLPYDDIQNEFIRKSKQREYFSQVEKEEVTSLAWKERIDLYFLIIKYQEDLERNTLSGLYQEYFHVVVDESQKRIKSDYFNYLTNFECNYEHGYNWISGRINGDKEITNINVNIEFGIDIGSGSISGDYTSITIAGKDYKENVYIIDTVFGRFGVADTDKIGLADELLRLYKRFRPSKVKIGYAGNEKNFIEIIRKHFDNENIYVPVIGRVQAGNRTKEERIFSTLVYPYERKMVYHCRKLTDLETQLEFLGSTEFDDIADSCEVAVHGLQPGDNIKYENMFGKSNYIPPYYKYTHRNKEYQYGSDDIWLNKLN